MLVLFLILLLGIIAFFKTDVKDKFIKPKYEEVIKSDIDYDSDGLDDYTDILNGAKEFISTKPKYKSKYYDGGYPTDEYRVCTDIIWYALKNAGYDFKTLIDEDIKNNKEEYDEDVGDENIDFRRVRNIKVYLDWTGENRHPKTLTINDYDTLMNSDFLIARKFDEKIDGEIINKLESKLKMK